MGLGSWVVRDLHVSATPRDLIAHVNYKLKPESRLFPFREERHKLIREALESHFEHQALVKHFRM